MDYLPFIKPILVSGCAVNCKGNWQYDCEDRVVVSFSTVLTLIENNEYSTKHLKKFPTTEDEMNLMAVSKDKKLCAVAFRNPIPYIYVTDLTTKDKFRLLKSPLNVGYANEYTAMDFSVDNRYVGAILGPPDWLLLCYRWEQSSLRNYTKAVYTLKVNTVTSICYNPFDRKTALLTGQNQFRQANIKKTRWEDYGYCITQEYKVKFTTGCWVSKREAVVGTNDGRLFVITMTRILQVYKAFEAGRLFIPDLKDQSIKVIHQHKIPPAKAHGKGVYVKDVDNMILYGDRLAFTLGRFEIFVYKNTEPSVWCISDVLNLYLNPYEARPVTDCTPRFTSLSINTKQTHILAGMSDGRAYESKITEITKEQSNEFLHSELILYGPSLNHSQGVQCVATCLWKTIFATVGRDDGLVKVWDYKLKSPMFTTHYRQGIYSISLHPAGMYVLLGMRQYLDLCVYTVSSFQKYYRFETRRCKASCFSEDGNMLAYSRESFTENSVVLVNVHTLKCIRVFENHLLFDGGELRILNETHIVNLVDGFYQVQQNIQEETDDEDAYMTMKIEELKDVLVLKDGVIAEFQYDKDTKSSNFIRECFVPTFVESSLTISKTSTTRNFIVYGFEDGRIMTTAHPHLSAYTWTLSKIHREPVRRIALTRNDSIMLTTDNSGTLIIWRLGNLYSDRMKMTHIPYDILNKHFLVECDYGKEYQDSDDLRYNFPLSDTERSKELFFRRIGVTMVKPIQEHYDYLFKVFSDKEKKRGVANLIEMQNKAYQKGLELKASALEMIKQQRELNKRRIKNIKLARDMKKEVYERAMTSKLNYMALLNSSRCFTKFFTFEDVYTEFHDLLASRWVRAKGKVQNLQKAMVRVGEYICRLVYIGMRKEFAAKANVLTNLECYIKTQVATIVDLRRKLILRQQEDLEKLRKSMILHLYIILMSDTIVNRFDILYMRKKIMRNAKLFRMKKRSVVGETIRALLKEFEARQLFLNFDPEYWSEKLKRSDAVLDAYWLQEWKAFKEVFNDYLFVRLCTEDLKRRVNIKKNIIKKEQRFRLKKKCKLQSRNNDTQIFSDLFTMTWREINKSDRFYKVLETALVLNTDTNFTDSYFTKLLVLTTYKSKDLVTNDLLYNIETYDICMRLIREEEEIIDESIKPKDRVKLQKKDVVIEEVDN